MKIVKVEGIYKASRISGPKHNFLGLSVTNIHKQNIQCIQQKVNDNADCQIDEQKLLAAVTEGVSAANREIDASLFVELIEYVPTDTPEYHLYKELTKAIILFAATDLEADK